MADPVVVQVMREYQRQLAAREALHMAEMARRWMGVEDALADSITRLWHDIAARLAAGKTVTRTQVLEMARYQDLVMQTRREIHGYISTYAEGAISREQALMIRLAERHSEGAVSAILGSSLNFLPVMQAQAMVGLTAAGTPLRILLEQAWPTAVDGLTNELLRAVALGINPREAAAAMRAGVTTGLDRMLAIARTEELRVYRFTSLEGYRQSGVVRGYRRLCARQERTCLACLALDGTFYELSSSFSDHVNGRCTCVPSVIGYRDETWQTGKTWLEGLDEGAQRRIMGNARYELWQQGTPIESMVRHVDNPTWGPSVGIRPLSSIT